MATAYRIRHKDRESWLRAIGTSGEREEDFLTRQANEMGAEILSGPYGFRRQEDRIVYELRQSKVEAE